MCVRNLHARMFVILIRNVGKHMCAAHMTQYIVTRKFIENLTRQRRSLMTFLAIKYIFTFVLCTLLFWLEKWEITHTYTQYVFIFVSLSIWRTFDELISLLLLYWKCVATFDSIESRPESANRVASLSLLLRRPLNNKSNTMTTLNEILREWMANRFRNKIFWGVFFRFLLFTYYYYLQDYLQKK